MYGRSYRDLELWQKTMDLLVRCYCATKSLSKSEVYALASQMQRASVSIPANIAEGQGRQHRPEFVQHLSIAYGWLTELETHIQIPQRLNYLDGDDAKRLLLQTGEVGRLLNGLLRFLRRKGSKPDEPLSGHRIPTTDNR